MGHRVSIILRLSLAIVASANSWIFHSSAQNYPVKQIRMLVGYGTGGAADISARLVAQKLSEHFGQPVIVENRPGATGSIAIDAVAKAVGDGYTLIMIAAGDAIVPAMRTKLPYALERDLAAVSLVATVPFVLVVHPLVPAFNIKDLIAIARSQPGKLSYGSTGVGGSPHLLGELFSSMAKLQLVHVPYKGAAEASIAVASGQIDMNFPSVTAALALLTVKKVRALAVTSITRASLLPSLPTIEESGLPGFNRFGWYGVLTSARVPKDIIATLNMAIGKVVNAADMKEALNKHGIEPQTSTPERFAEFIHSEIVQNTKLIKLAGVKVE